jgi:hypothetical protein
MVFVGLRLCDEKYAGGPGWALPMDEKTLFEFVADCELNCVKLRAEEFVNAAASGDIREAVRGRELRSSVEAVVAGSRVRDAIVRFGGGDDDSTRSSDDPSADVCRHLRRNFRLAS